MLPAQLHQNYLNTLGIRKKMKKVNVPPTKVDRNKKSFVTFSSFNSFSLKEKKNSLKNKVITHSQFLRIISFIKRI